MRIADRYQSLMDRVGPGTARKADNNASTQKSPTSATSTTTTTSSDGGLQVSVSDRAQQLSAGSARLDELKASIANGSFKVNAQAIASRMLGEDA